MEDIYETLEVGSVLRETLPDVHSEINRERLLSLKMFSDPGVLEKELALTAAMLQLIETSGPLPFSSSFDLAPLLLHAEKGGILSVRDLDHVASDLLLAVRLKRHLEHCLPRSDNELSMIVKELLDLTPLAERIRKVVLPNLLIADDASSLLSRIRRKLKVTEKALRLRAEELLVTYQAYLSEGNLTIRNGHFVLPVSVSYQGRVPGVVHDYSSTHQTAFIEPTALIIMNNEILLLHDEENEEIRRLLKELTEHLLTKKEKIVRNNELIARLDLLQVKALFGVHHQGQVARLSHDRLLHAEGVRHPLIPAANVVANDFHFDPKQRIIIISGPNAGGKTIALKTLGLLIVLNQMAFPVLTRKQALLPFFPNVHVDIGDNQSLSDNLSTFSAHIRHLSEIIADLSAEDLVLLDELGTGTSPREGEALAIAVTSYLKDKGAYALISSHYEGLKEYAAGNDGVVNAMMVFDETRLLPTYALRIGLPGKSYGLVMAKVYDLPAAIVENAKKALREDGRGELSDLLERLREKITANEKEKEELAVREKELKAKERLLEEREEKLKKRKNDLLVDVEEKKKELLEKARKEIETALEVLRDPSRKEHELIAAKTALRKIGEESLLVRDEKEEQRSDPSSIVIDDYVRVIDLGLCGRVQKVKGDRLTLLTSDGLSVSVKRSAVERTTTPIQRKEPSVIKTPLTGTIRSVPVELDLIGLHVAEALPVLGKFLDDALLARKKQVRIIHGFGSGRLREAVHAYLKSQSFVVSYRYGERSEGGEGATIVILG